MTAEGGRYSSSRGSLFPLDGLDGLMEWDASAKSGRGFFGRLGHASGPFRASVCVDFI